MNAPASAPSATTQHRTACVLCSLNCGLVVETDGTHLTRIRGDEDHPSSHGYLCQKAARLDHYLVNDDRLTHPLRRRPDGTFEQISWDVAIAEIAARLRAIRDTHGGHALAYYGGGGQGNHLGGVYSAGFRAALRTRYLYTALAQEKTGDFWVNGRLFGRQTSHVGEAVEESDYVVLIGTNPWQAHGIPRARDVVRELGRDPARTLVVIDPRRTETARLADLHLAVRPGTDAFLLAAILATILREGLEDRTFLAARTTGLEAVRAALGDVPIERYAAVAGIPMADVEVVARGLAKARAACIRDDLGVQQSLHSTLNSYLAKLLFLLTGNLGKPGSNGFHSTFAPLIGHSDGLLDESARTRVTKAPEISKLYPPNVLPAEIDSDAPDRLRGLVVDSANPLVSGADTHAYRRAFAKLELLVVVDVAMTETARLAHYVLPAATQYEKWECTFFNFSFPTNWFHLRRPVLPPRGDVLPEPEIYRRLVVAMGELPDRFPVLEAIARLDRRVPRLGLFPLAFAATLKLRPRLARQAPLVALATLGRALPDGAAAASVLWLFAQAYVARHGDAVRRTGLAGKGRALGEALFARILASPSGMVLSEHVPEDTWQWLRHADRKVHLEVPEMTAALSDLARELPVAEAEAAAAITGAGGGEYPFVLVAGERRAYNANTILRDPAWRKQDPEGRLRIHPADAARLGLADGDAVACESARGSVTVRIERTDVLQPGVLTLPHGFGMVYGSGEGARAVGPWLNELTAAEHCDPIARTPFHKYVRVRLRPLGAAAAA